MAIPTQGDFRLHAAQVYLLLFGSIGITVT